MKYPRISIVTPSFNQGQFIERTIQSVLDQNYPNLEYIVMDGGSTDNTLKILKKYQAHLNYISEPDKGQTDAINKGLRMASGEILAYLNSDDTYEPGSLKTVAKFFADHPRAYFVYGKGRLIDSQDHEIGFYNSLTADLGELHQHCPISQPTAFWRRRVMETVGLFDDSFNFTMDYEYWVRVAQKFKLHFLDQTLLANARIHDSAKTSAFTHKLHRDAIRVQQKYFPFVHHDWIFTYTHQLIHNYKDQSGWRDYWYYFALIAMSFFLQLYWNHRLPTSAMLKQYWRWAGEVKNKHVKS